MSLWAVIDPLEIDVGELDDSLGQGIAKGLHAWEWPARDWMAHPDEPLRDDVLVGRQAGGEGRLPVRLRAQVPLLVPMLFLVTFMASHDVLASEGAMSRLSAAK